MASLQGNDVDSDDDMPPMLLDLGESNESCRENEINKKVPVTILAGFLGSGKTTLIQYILNSPDHHFKIAIIENEFAGVDNDSEENSLAIESLIARDGTTLNGDYDNTNDRSNLISLTELPNGCVCCTVKDSLVATLEKLVELKGDELDYIIIEASGMANPGPIASIFWLDEDLDSSLKLDGIVTLVDAKHIEMQLRDTGSSSDYPSVDNPEISEKDNEHAMTSGFEAERQIAYADRILLNKVDLLPDQNKIDHVHNIIYEINPNAPIQKTVFSKVPDLKWIMDTNCLDSERVQNIFSEEGLSGHGSVSNIGSKDHKSYVEVNNTTDTSKGHCIDDDCSHNDCHDHSHHHDHDNDTSHTHHEHSHSHTSSVKTITLVYPNQSINLKQMHSWLATILWPDQDKNDSELRWILEDPASNPNYNKKSKPQPKSMRIFRMKGILSVCHSNPSDLVLQGVLASNDMPFIDPISGWDKRRHIVQVVHDLWEIHPASKNLCWDSESHADIHGCKLVLIGQWLNRKLITEGFEQCLIK